MSRTLHARTRAQQRGIPPLIDRCLDDYGEEQYDGHGGVILFLSKQSRRRMERDMGREPVRRLSEWLDAYKVVSSHDGQTITIGHRNRRIPRR